jgi:hypothetical protein
MGFRLLRQHRKEVRQDVKKTLFGASPLAVTSGEED